MLRKKLSIFLLILGFGWQNSHSQSYPSNLLTKINVDDLMVDLKKHGDQSKYYEMVGSDYEDILCLDLSEFKLMKRLYKLKDSEKDKLNFKTPKNKIYEFKSNYKSIVELFDNTEELKTYLSDCFKNIYGTNGSSNLQIEKRKYYKGNRMLFLVGGSRLYRAKLENGYLSFELLSTIIE